MVVLTEVREHSCCRKREGKKEAIVDTVKSRRSLVGRWAAVMRRKMINDGGEKNQVRMSRDENKSSEDESG